MTAAGEAAIEQSQGAEVRGRIDLARLYRRLKKRVRGAVRFERGDLGAYAYDGSIYRQLPLGVVLPRDGDDVVEALAACREVGAPVLPRGCGTSLAGQCCNFAVVLDFSKYMNRILEIDPERKTARVEPGVICDQLRAAAEKHGLTYAPDPATHDHCTFGGMIGNNSCGTHSVMGGKTVDNVLELEVLLYDGTRLRVGETSEAELARLASGEGRRSEIYRGLRSVRDRYGDLVRQRFPQIPRRVSGYNLDDLFPDKHCNVARALVGSEGTCVVVLAATIRLVESPQHRSLVVLGYHDIPAAGDAAAAIMEHRPIALEHFNRSTVDRLERKGEAMVGEDLLPPGEAWLLAEFGGDTQEAADEAAEDLVAALREQDGAPTVRLCRDPAEEARVWGIRESGVGASRIPPFEHGGWPNWEDAALPVPRLGDYLREFFTLCRRHGYHPSLFGHFGQGCVHCRMDWRLRDRAGVQDFVSFMEEAARLVVAYGGSLSGEHGDGHGRASLWPLMFGDDLVHGFGEFKAIWDPLNRMNPGKLIAPYRMDQHLREGTGYAPIEVRTRFRFSEDGGSFAEAAGRCFGVGKCRRLDGGTMCPSFMVTREETFSTRGRARLLNEMMLHPKRPDRPWRDEGVKEALDLCLACKGCKGDCPVQVDMATYKAEFLSHYYEGRLRPAPAYAMGLIMRWAQLAELAPGPVNLAIDFPVLGKLGRRAIGLAPQRTPPPFARTTFVRWFARRGGARNPHGDPVILWPDTFNNHFHPGTAIAATEVLERAGYRIVVPRAKLCCGRPLFDYGMVDRAKGMLERVLEDLRPLIRQGVPLIGLEPSCTATFRDELVGLLPHDADAMRLRKQ
ncbi:MAG: FAD-binding and (Fe-S)-binding domain-containing protein, partial [Candidatus Dormibacteraceae bacterium]